MSVPKLRLSVKLPTEFCTVRNSLVPETNVVPLNV